MVKKLILMIILITGAYGKELIDVSVLYDTIQITKYFSNEGKELMEITGLYKGDLLIKEIYENKKLIYGERYKYNNKGKKYLFYLRKTQKFIDDEVVYYENGNKRQEFVLYPNGIPFDNKFEKFDENIKFIYAYYNLEGDKIERESGLYYPRTNILFSPIFDQLPTSKEIIDVMELKK